MLCIFVKTIWLIGSRKHPTAIETYMYVYIFKLKGKTGTSVHKVPTQRDNRRASRQIVLFICTNFWLAFLLFSIRLAGKGSKKSISDCLNDRRDYGCVTN